MIDTRKVTVARALIAACLVAVGISGSLRADDTEIYQASYDDENNGSRPKVLIVFDNSGSMGRIVTGQKPAYSSTGVYVNTFDNARVYWSTNGKPPAADSDNYFAATKNRCAESYDPLRTVGYFQTKAARWETDGKDDSWNTLSTSDRDPIHVDCLVDVVNENPSNGAGQGNGYPKKPAKRAAVPGEEYSAATADASNVSWGNSAYTFYSAHYMNWNYDATIGTQDRTRIDIAREVVTNLINANTGIDFGLEVFNYNFPNNDPYHGGRIVRRIINGMSLAERNSLVDMVNSLSARTSTPLCESTYEAYRYIAGLSVEWGDNKAVLDLPDRDRAAELAGKYIRPSTDCTYTYVILMTDGFPQYDTQSNNAIKALDGVTGCDKYEDYNGDSVENCLPQLTKYMATHDLDNDANNGDQFGITYTIGFTVNQKLLSDAATYGKGQYYTADSADQLTAAFREAILGILATDATFTSPAVAIDSFTRTESRDDVYFSMFKPKDSVDWAGNIKKLKIVIADGIATMVDKNGAAAINPANGAIAADASTYWSVRDGGNVEAGGMGALLAARDPAGRNILTNSGANGALEAFTSGNLDAAAFGFDISDPGNPDAALFDEFGVSDQVGVDAAIKWGRGYEVQDDGTIVGTRPWILADMLHSQPLVVNYGALGGFTKANPELRVVVGTNAGFLHMFGNDNGEEDWAFFPKELAAVLKKRADDRVTNQHVYGIDSSPVLYSRDINHDGTLDAADGDTAYLYFGLRRGGRMLYALDISNPDDPVFMWHIDATKTGFTELGQTWSDPVVTRIPGYVDADGVPKPVLVFGAGYDPAKDADGVAVPDTMGRGIYIVDALTGALVWSVTPGITTLKNLQEPALEHSVAANIRVLDSNGDRLTDRIYFADTGGNIWRVDLPGNVLPVIAQDTWRIVKLAAFNGGTAATDRRFFNAVDIVRTTYAGKTFDAILIGTGDRTRPKDRVVDNQFYMIRDQKVGLYFTALDPSTDCDNDPATVDDLRCELPLGIGDLYDVTSNDIQNGTDLEKAAALANLAAADGWRLDLTAVGEKSLSRSLTIGGKVYFGTFSPDVGLANLCLPTPGTGRLYVVNLLNASAEIDFDEDDIKERSWIIGALIPDTPSVHISGEDDDGGQIRLLLPPGTLLPIIETEESLANPYGDYWYREDY